MTKPELIKAIKAKRGIYLSITYLESLSLDKLKKLYEKYVPKMKEEKDQACNDLIKACEYKKDLFVFAENYKISQVGLGG